MPKTAVILGAGASADFGLPLGSALFDIAFDKMKKFRAELREASGRAFWDYTKCIGWANADSFRKTILSVCESEDQKINFDPALELTDLMQEAPAYSIDTLALENPEYLALCRVIVARLIIDSLQRQIVKDERGDEIWGFAHRKVPSSSGMISNWVHLFVSMMRNSIRKEPDQSYLFISFNYDQLAEKIMRRIWAKPSQNIGALDQFARFTYPHGKISWGLGDRGASRLSVAESELVFAYNKSGLDAFAEARDFLSEAEQIVSLGFHFAPENIRSLFPEDMGPHAALTYQNYEGNKGLDRRVEDAGFIDARSFEGSIAEAINQGELGELPS